MKKISTYTMMFITSMMMMATLSSCDRGGRYTDYEDNAEARTLHGTWTGTISQYFMDRWGEYRDTYRTTWQFNQLNAYGGTGYEIDYDIYDRYVGYYCSFIWEVANGVIRIKYDDSWGTVLVYDYVLDGNYFSGYLDDGTRRDIYFRLYYDGNFNWNTWRGRWYYYGHQNNADWADDESSDSIVVPKDSIK